MGTHPIFESDFDCLTDNWRWDVSSEPVVKVLAVSSRPAHAPARAQPSTGQWTLLKDMDLSRVSQRTSFTIQAEVLHSSVLPSRTHTNTARTPKPSSLLKVQPLDNLSTAVTRLPSTLAMCSQSEICEKVPPVAQLKGRSVTVVSSPRLPVTLPSSSHTTKILARPESSCHPVQRRSLTPDAVPPLVSTRKKQNKTDFGLSRFPPFSSSCFFQRYDLMHTMRRPTAL